uniref:Cyclic nucleotide-binding domain-containing protein n=1 Tax=Mycena chlorophos TaxID=658473 RepID=A0ABQ0LSQ5_MYCCL|nr:predicted protein [Mycena chlorophos]
MSTFEALVGDLTRDITRAQPKDTLQFCANWFQLRLEEQRTRTRDVLSQRPTRDLPADLYIDQPLGSGPPPVSPFSLPPPVHRSSLRNSTSSPFGTLNVPGNALLSDGPSPVFNINDHSIPPTSPFASFDGNALHPPGDYLHPPNSAILARRTSVSAESIAVTEDTGEPLPVFPKSPDQLRRIKASIASNLIFRDLDEEQETGVLNAMQEKTTEKDEVVIRQGDEGEYFYVVESGLLHCFIRPEPLPPTWARTSQTLAPEEKFAGEGYHPKFGKKVAECAPGTSFGELALMYGHPRAATVLSIEPATLWALDRITFRTIILKAAHRRRTMYEQFLSTVTLLSSLSASERSKIADALVSRVYADGEAVVRQGDMGDTFFFVEEGEATVTKSEESGVGPTGTTSEVKVGHLKKGDYFGELSLLRLAPRAATVSAVVRESNSGLPRLKVAALDAPAFTRLLGVWPRSLPFLHTTPPPSPSTTPSSFVVHSISRPPLSLIHRNRNTMADDGLGGILTSLFGFGGNPGTTTSPDTGIGISLPGVSLPGISLSLPGLGGASTTPTVSTTPLGASSPALSSPSLSAPSTSASLPATSSAPPSATTAPPSASTTPGQSLPDQTQTSTNFIVVTSSGASVSPTAAAAHSESFLQNKALSGAVFGIVGFVALVLLFAGVTFFLRRQRRSRLLDDALSFDPALLAAADRVDGSEKGHSTNPSLGGAGYSSYAASSYSHHPQQDYYGSQQPMPQDYYGQQGPSMQQEYYNQPAYGYAPPMAEASAGSWGQQPMQQQPPAPVPTPTPQPQQSHNIARVAVPPTPAPLPEEFGSSEDADARRRSAEETEFWSRTLKVVNE